MIIFQKIWRLDRKRNRGLIACFAAALMLLLINETSSQDDFKDEWNEQLRPFGVQPGIDGLHAYFRSFQPDVSAEKKVKSLIQKLGSNDYSERKSATLELFHISQGELHLVEEATLDPDLEISLRAKQVVRQYKNGIHLKRLQQILGVIAEQQIKGLVQDISRTMQVVRPSNYLKVSFERVLKQTADEADHDYLMNLVENDELYGRDVFLRVAAKVKPEGNADRFAVQLAKETDESMKLALAKQLAATADRRCLAPLIGMLDNPSIRIRSQANVALRMVTGKSFGFVAVANDETRNKSIESWKNWLAKESKEAPLFVENQNKPVFVNRLIVGSYSQRLVFEMDLEGNVLRRFTDVGSPMGVCGAPDGRVLICDYSGREFLVFDDQKKIILRKKLGAGPLGGELLANGNVLVGVSSTKEVHEYSPEGKLVWKAKVPGRVNVVHRTRDNTTLVSMLGEGKIVELDESGKTIFELEVTKPNGIRRLENGNLLVCMYDAGELREYDPDKNIVWKLEGLTKPCRAQRMPDGNTIIYDRDGVKIYDAQTEKLRKFNTGELKGGGVGSLHYF